MCNMYSTVLEISEGVLFQCVYHYLIIFHFNLSSCISLSLEVLLNSLTGAISLPHCVWPIFSNCITLLKFLTQNLSFLGVSIELGILSSRTCEISIYFKTDPFKKKEKTQNARRECMLTRQSVQPLCLSPTHTPKVMDGVITFRSLRAREGFSGCKHTFYH